MTVDAPAQREHATALALSGGGYRAALFHCGALLRLNEAGLLAGLKRISSVSGGSIVSGVVAVKWPKLVPDGKGGFRNLQAEVIDVLREFCRHTLDVGAVLSGAINPFKSIGDELIDAYRHKLGLGVPLASLTKSGPRFVFNSTNYATGVTFRFSQEYCADYRIGMMKTFKFDVATAVAASSAFPPVFSPITLDVDPTAFEKDAHADLYDNEAFRSRLLLADGGVYDNMGLETVWRRYDTVFVSDGGKPFEVDSRPAGNLVQMYRVADIALNQALALRKRMLIDAYESTDSNHHLDGAYWGIDTQIANYGLGASALPVSPDMIRALARMRTRLNRFTDEEQEELINWGYAVSDAGLRARYKPLSTAPIGTFPFPHRKMV